MDPCVPSHRLHTQLASLQLQDSAGYVTSGSSESNSSPHRISACGSHATPRLRSALPPFPPQHKAAHRLKPFKRRAGGFKKSYYYSTSQNVHTGRCMYVCILLWGYVFTSTVASAMDPRNKLGTRGAKTVLVVSLRTKADVVEFLWLSAPPHWSMSPRFRASRDGWGCRQFSVGGIASRPLLVPFVPSQTSPKWHVKAYAMTPLMSPHPTRGQVAFAPGCPMLYLCV